MGNHLRAEFVKQAAHELAAKEDTIHRDVGQLWTATRGAAAASHRQGAWATGRNIADDGPRQLLWQGSVGWLRSHHFLYPQGQR